MCSAAGYTGSVHRCDIYKNTAAGETLKCAKFHILYQNESYLNITTVRTNVRVPRGQNTPNKCNKCLVNIRK